MKVAFIGLGMMGKPMAINLVKGGIDLTVVNRSQGKVQELAAMGAHAGESAASAAANADVAALCLADESTIEAVLLGERGVLSTIRKGSIVLDHSTVHPEFAKRMAASCAESGVTYLDAPVSGTGQVAVDGKLTIMVGGDADAYERIQPVLAPVSVRSFLMGPVGSGNMTKLINNMIGDINQIAVMEAFALGAGLGMDMRALFEALRSASANSRQLERIGPKLLERNFAQTSTLGGHVRGQERMAWLCEQAGLQLPLREVAEDFWRRGVEAGLGPADPVKAITMLEAESGVEVRGS